MDNKLKLSIITALDSAGIKATKLQIDELSNKIQSANNTNIAGTLKFLGVTAKLPGTLGKIAMGFRGIAAAAGPITIIIMAIVEAYNLLSSAREKLALHFDLFKTEAEKIEAVNKKMREAERIREEDAKLFKAHMDNKIKAHQKEQDELEKTTKKIDDLTRSYFRLVEALNGIKDARNNAKSIALEREKFEQLRYYQSMGYDLAAEQIGNYYDVLIQQENLQLKLQRIEEEKAETIKRENTELMKQSKYLNAIDDLLKKLAKSINKQWEVRRDLKKYAAASNEVEYLQTQLENTKEKERESREKIRLDYAGKYLKLDLDYANTMAQGSMNVDRAAWKYDLYVIRNGNPLNAEITDDLANSISEMSQKSWDYQRGIYENTAKYADALDRLLELKQ